MNVKGLVDEDFVNYKKPSMFIACPTCTFKCDKENGCQLCQNMSLASAIGVQIPIDVIIKRYLKNDISKAIVFGGLEPFDSFDDIKEFVFKLRCEYQCDDDVVIYTGYNKEEILDKICSLSEYKNIIIKFGRFRPNEQSHVDPILGVALASRNQYAEKIS